MRIVLCAWWGLLAAFVPSVRSLPPDFDDRVVFNTGRLVTDLDWAPTADGGHVMLISKKHGEVEVLTDPDNSDDMIVALDIEDAICTKGGQGLRGTAVHPNFLQNRWIYVFYTYDRGNAACPESFTTGPVNRVSRFTLDDSWKADRSSEVVFFDTRPLGLHGTHHGGCLAFGKDGYLYVTTGDASEPLLPLPPSQDYGDLFGKVLRFADDGAVPASNPFVGADGVSCKTTGITGGGKICHEIYATGLRNPYKCAMDPNASGTRLFVNDVGGGTWEEVSEVEEGGNLGWPFREGRCERGDRNNCKPDEQDSYVEPVYWYEHNENNNGAITGGDFLPNGVWPAEFTGAYFYAQFVYGKVNYIIPSPSLGCEYPDCDPPVPAFKNELFENLEQVTSFNFLPYKNTMAAFYVRAGGPAVVRRITFTGLQTNRQPVAVIGTDVTSGVEGLVVQFDGTQSSDADGDALEYEWDFGDGSMGSTQPRSTHQYNSRGTYEVTLVVTDPLGQEGRDTASIVVGTPPIPIIDSPAEGTKFAVGDLFVISGSATDHTGTTIPDSHLSWEVRRHHADHYHSFLNPLTPGNNLAIDAAPPPEDFFASTNSYLEVLLTATDNDGVVSTVSRAIQPKMVRLDFDTVPSGLLLKIDYYAVSTPAVVHTWENHGLHVEAVDQEQYTFTSWSSGEDQIHFIDVPPAINADPTAATASFVATFEIAGIVGQLLGTEELILSGSPRDYPSLGVFMEVTRTGQLVLLSGSSSNPGQRRWETPTVQPDGDYFVALQPDGNLVLRGGTPGSFTGAVWASASNRGPGEYFLALNSDDTIALYAGSLDSPGEIIWSQNLIALDAPPPTEYPTTELSSEPSTLPTLRPTLRPSAVPTSGPTAGPSSLPRTTAAPVTISLDSTTDAGSDGTDANAGKTNGDDGGDGGEEGGSSPYLYALLALLLPIAWFLAKGSRLENCWARAPVGKESSGHTSDVEADIAETALYADTSVPLDSALKGKCVE